MLKLPKHWFSLPLVALLVGVTSAACSDEDDDAGTLPGPGAGTGGRGSEGGGVSRAGFSAAGVSGSSSFGGRAPTAGSTSTGGSDPSIACNGLPYEAAAGGADAECVGTSSEVEPTPVDLFIMMDRSVSLGYTIEGSTKTRWQAMRESMQDFVDSSADLDLGIGIGFFNISGGADEQIDCDVARYARAKVGIGPIAEVGADVVAAMNIVPSGLTPTGPALAGALRYATEYHNDNPARPTLVVLVTDGFPTQCIANTQDALLDIEVMAKAARENEPFIRTYVIGLAGDHNLDLIARAGGTNKAFIVDEVNVSQTFSTALRNISATAQSCSWRIPEGPGGGMKVDLEKVQMIYSPAAGDDEEVPRVASADACARNPNGGWFYDDPTNPTRILVCPCTCSRFGAGRVDIKLGCEPSIGLR